LEKSQTVEKLLDELNKKRSKKYNIIETRHLSNHSLNQIRLSLLKLLGKKEQVKGSH